MIEETVTLEPMTVRVTVKLALVPTTTLPKSKLVGATLNWPGLPPVPEREIVRGELDAFETTEMFPAVRPAEMGVKTTPIVALSRNEA